MTDAERLALMLQQDRSVPMATPTGEFIPTPPLNKSAQVNPYNPIGLGETALSLGTGAIAAPLAGWYGAGTELFGGDGKAAAGKLADALTYKPTTDYGQASASAFSDFADKTGISSLPPVVSGIPTPRLGAGATRYAGQQYGMPMLEKSLTMYEQGKLTPGFKPVSEMFVGPTSKTWDANAPTMTGPEGLLRQEISDKNTFLRGTGNYQNSVMDFLRNNENLVNKQGGEVLLQNVFEAPDLYAAYPELQNYKMRFLPSEGALKGRKGSDNTMWVRENLTPEEARSTILHEIQHHIQENEGFARGGSANVLAKQPLQEHKHYMSAIENLNKQMKEAAGTPQYAALMDERDALVIEARQRGVLYPEQITAIANDKYKRLGGEAEARLTQARSDMTKDELAAANPYDPAYFKEKTGVNLEDLIFQGNRKRLLQEEFDKLGK